MLVSVLGALNIVVKLPLTVVTRACSRGMAIFEVSVDFRRTNCRLEESIVMPILYVGGITARYITLAQSFHWCLCWGACNIV